VTKPIKALLSSAISQLNRPLRIIGLLATRDSGCHMYADMTAHACQAAEVVFDKVDMSTCRASGDDAAFEQVHRAIELLNDDPTLDGLIVYFPLFSPVRDATLRALINPRIDVEDVNPTSLESSYAKAPETVEELMAHPATGIIYPCTALAVFRALQAPEVGLYTPARPAGERFRGKTVTIINRYAL
jgi:methylenetetrahydrofolate dehydrogenase (NAD+)